jgi:hypothetical protein
MPAVAGAHGHPRLCLEYSRAALEFSRAEPSPDACAASERSSTDWMQATTSAVDNAVESIATSVAISGAAAKSAWH